MLVLLFCVGPSVWPRNKHLVSKHRFSSQHQIVKVYSFCFCDLFVWREASGEMPCPLKQMDQPWQWSRCLAFVIKLFREENDKNGISRQKIF